MQQRGIFLPAYSFAQSEALTVFDTEKNSLYRGITACQGFFNERNDNSESNFSSSI